MDDPAATLAELARVVQPGGGSPRSSSACPEPPLWRPLWWLYTRIGLPGLGRLFGRDWYEVGRFLGPSIEALYERWPLERQLELWASGGMSVQAAGGG